MPGDYNTLDGIIKFPVDPKHGLPDNELHLRRQIRNRVKAKFEDWLELNARKRVFYLRHELTSDEFRESMQAVQESVGSGTFRWGGSGMLDALKSIPGIAEMITLLVHDAGQVGVTIQQVIELLTDAEYALPLKESLQDILKAGPNFIVPPLRDRMTGEAID